MSWRKKQKKLVVIERDKKLQRLKNMETQFLKRFKSFTWRLGAYLVVAGLVWIADNIGLLELPPYVSAVIALIVGELTKYLNTGRMGRR